MTDAPAGETGDSLHKERLQKLLARAGYGSRRACEELIVSGRVSLNEQTVTVLGTQADPMRDVIAVDGERIHLSKPTYWVYHKPEGVFFSDQNSDATLRGIVDAGETRLFTVGRLDRLSSGMMLMTNDGRTANVLTHPRYRVPKVYKITVRGDARPDQLHAMERALYYALEGGKFEPLKVVKRWQGKSVLRLTIYEGLPPSLRDILLKYGLSVRHVERLRIGPLELTGLEPGRSRKLHPHEVSELLKFAEEAEAGRLNYEAELVTPSGFDRDKSLSSFERKKKGSRGTSEGGQKRIGAKVHREARGQYGDRPPRRDGDRPRGDRPPRFGSDRPRGDRPPRRDGDRPPRFGSDRPRGDRPPRFGSDRPRGDRPPRFGSDRPRGDRPPRFGSDRPRGDRPPRRDGDRPSGDRPPRFGGDRPRGARPPRRDGDRPRGDRPPRFGGDRPRGARPPRRDGDRPRGDRPPRFGSDRPRGARPPRRDGDRPSGPRRPRRDED